MVSVGPKAGKLNIGMGLRTQGVSELGLDCWWVDLELQKVLTLVLACSLVRLGSGRSWSQCRLIGDWSPVPGSLACKALGVLELVLANQWIRLDSSVAD